MSNPDNLPVMVTTTCDQREILNEIADQLVESRLAACCQIGGPIESVYRWENRIETAQEWICWIKTTSKSLEMVVAEIDRLHSYDVPEIIALPVVGGNPRYLNWIADQCDTKKTT